MATVDPDAPDGLLVNSFNGGDPLAIKDDLRAKGLLPQRQTRRDHRPFRKHRAPSAQPFEPDSIFEYVGLDGEVLYRTVRIDQPGGEKTFRAEHQDDTGRWVPGRGRPEPVLYRLPDVAGVDDDAIVFMAEGERKADKLAHWGFPATSSKFLPPDLSVFQGRSVAILPDNDEQGQKIAESALRALEDAGAHPVIVTLPDLPSKGDIIDWEGSPDELWRLAVEAFEPCDAERTNDLPSLDLSALDGQPVAPREWALKDFIPAGQMTLFPGPGGVGKSLLGQQLCSCIAAGLPFLGIEAMQGPALYLTAEDDAAELHRRQTNICEALGRSLASLAGRLHLVPLFGRLGNEIAVFDRQGVLEPTDTYDALKRKAEATGATFIVLDNVAHLFAGNENDRGQVTQFCNLLNGLCRDTGATVLLVAHPNKAGDDFSGSTAWLNAVRSQIALNYEKDADGAILDPDARVLSLGKANYARKGLEVRFRWHAFAFRLDAELPSDVVKETVAAGQIARENEIFLACLRERNRQQRPVGANPGPNYAPAQFEGMREAKGLKRGVLKKAMDRLFATDLIGIGFVCRDRQQRRDREGIIELSTKKN